MKIITLFFLLTSCVPMIAKAQCFKNNKNYFDVSGSYTYYEKYIETVQQNGDLVVAIDHGGNSHNGSITGHTIRFTDGFIAIVSDDCTRLSFIGSTIWIKQ